MPRNSFAKEGSAKAELIAIRGPVGAPRPSAQCRGSNRGPHDGNIGESRYCPIALMADHIHTREVQVCDLSAKTNPEPKGRTAHRSGMGSAKKESILDRGFVPHLGIPLPYTRLNPSTRPSMLNVIS